MAPLPRNIAAASARQRMIALTRPRDVGRVLLRSSDEWREMDCSMLLHMWVALPFTS